MSAAVVTVAQQKGGAGKSTLVAQLAVALARKGLAVACLDIDPQATLSQWAALRAREAGHVSLRVESSQGWKLKLAVDELARTSDLVLIDSPPHAATEARTAIRAARLVLVPCQPSLLDVWASDATLALAHAEGRDAVVVWNRVPPRGRVVEEAAAALAERGHGALATGLGNRSAFAHSMHRGAGVLETEPRGRAAHEIVTLGEAVRGRLL